MFDSSIYTSFSWSKGQNIQFLVDGQQFFPAMLEGIYSANKYILMEMYLFESGEITNAFVSAFATASNRGVTVQLLIDAYGGLALSKSDRLKMTDSGVQLVFYNPLMFRKLKKNLFRTHRKYLIIDGVKVFVGGAGITDDFNGENAWRETVVEVQGSVVADWQSMFSKNFSHWSKALVPHYDGSMEVGEVVPARLAYTTGGTRQEIKKVLLERMNNSAKTVWFASAYFIPSRRTRKALRSAAFNGKDVRLLLPGDLTDHPSVSYASRRYYARLLRFGVRIFEYQGRFTHTKMVLIDDWVTIGSSNMDRWNFRWNLEANQEFEDKDVALNAREIMLNDFKCCKEIKYLDWVQRSRFQRFKEWIWGRLDIILSKYFDLRQ